MDDPKAAHHGPDSFVSGNASSAGRLRRCRHRAGLDLRDLAAIGHIQVALDLWIVNVVASHNGISSGNHFLFWRLLRVQILDRHLHRRIPDVIGVLGDQDVNDAVAQIRDLLRAGIETDDFDLALLASLADGGCCALRSKEIRAEDTGKIRMLLQLGGRLSGCRGRVIIVVVKADVFDVRVVLDLFFKALLALIGCRDAGFDVGDVDLALAAD